MFRAVLVANRGEIAVRVLRTLRGMGVRSVAVHSEADRGALHAKLADVAVEIGPPPVRQSYLDIDRILAAAKETGAEAIHPGYGLLSENADFAEACERAGLAFIGPRPETIREMGLKASARRRMAAAGVPVVPGSDGDVATLEAALERAGALGYPVLLKPSAGGGGIGMVECADPADLAVRFPQVGRRAESAFGNGAIYVEKRIGRARHVEVQIFGDGAGGVVHLFERECSVQRRHQKVIEETPSPALDDASRERLLGAAVAGASALRYRNAGTMEFLLDVERGSFHFIEANTRIQVEHPVTEMTTGIDLVEAQVRLAAGEAPPLRQDSVRRRGHAVEVRLYAEDPSRGYVPSPGRIGTLEWPSGPGVRVDAGVEAGTTVTPFYDPLLAKVIAHGDDRSGAIARMAGALAGTRIEGIRTNLDLLRSVMEDGRFRRGDYDTAFLETQRGVKEVSRR